MTLHLSVLALYTRASGKHESALSLLAIGRPSYISVKLYVEFPFQANCFSNLTCNELHTITTLHLTPTYVLLSLAKFAPHIHISQLKLSSPSSQHYTVLVSTPPSIMQLLRRLQTIAVDLDNAASKISKDLKKKRQKEEQLAPKN